MKMNANKSLTMLCGAVGLAGSLLPSEASAAVCTFTSSQVTYNEVQSGQTLNFSWDNTTGAVQNSGSSCSATGSASGGTAYWDNKQGGALYTYCGLSTSPGTVTPGFVLAQNSRSEVYLGMTYGGSGSSYEIRGTLHSNSVKGSSAPVIFSGAQYGSLNALLVGYGSVSCTP